jgi:photosystem II stability/assembly factor-like uncharacterized protein
MRMRLMALASVSLIAAGCSAASVQAGGGSAASSAASTIAQAASAGPAASEASSAPAATAVPGTAVAGTTAGANPAKGGCAGPATPWGTSYEAGELTGIEFVSPDRGWAVGQHTIMATTDGGARWQVQLSGNLDLSSVDFISGQDGWAAGPTTLLATTDGGAHWTSLPEPCPLIDSVHFISPTTGFAVAGGRDSGATVNPMPPDRGGVVLTTTDGGRTWRTLATPANAQTVCFSDPRHGWLGAAGLLYRTSNGGRNWTVLTSTAGTQLGSGESSYTAGMVVECAGDGSAWALRVGPGAAMSQEPHVGYHADQSGATPIFAEQYFQLPGRKPVAEAPGSIAGPFSALSPTAAAFIDYCSACGPGTAPWDVATNSGATLTKEGNVGGITNPQAASFMSPEVGWVTGLYSVFPASGKPRYQERVVATTDGGRVWQVQWAGPWSSTA